MIDLLPLCLIYYFALYLNATNTCALRLVCKKFSKIPLNRFRLLINGKLPSGEYYYITYNGIYPHLDLKNCTIRKLWLKIPQITLCPSTKVFTLVVNSSYWCLHCHPRMRDSSLNHNINNNKTHLNKCYVLGEYGYARIGKNLTVTSYNGKPYPPEYISKFKKVKTTDENLDISNIKKLHVSYCEDLVLKNSTQLTFLELSYADDEVILPPNLRTLKLTHCYTSIKSRLQTLEKLPEKLEKLKIKTANANVINSLIIPRSLRWFKLIIPRTLKIYIPNISAELNIRFIVKIY
jgi:hypothetical protein